MREPDSQLNGDGFVMFSVEDVGDGYSWLIRSDDIELVNDGPVREVTRREIVPGVYGRVVVESCEDCEVAVSFTDESRWLNADELREAAHLFNQLAEALED